MRIAFESGGAPLRPSASSALNLKTPGTQRTAEGLKKTKRFHGPRTKAGGMAFTHGVGHSPDALFRAAVSASSALNLKTPGPA